MFHLTENTLNDNAASRADFLLHHAELRHPGPTTASIYYPSGTFPTLRELLCAVRRSRVLRVLLLRAPAA